MCSLVAARGTQRTLAPLPGRPGPHFGPASGGAEFDMTIIRDHSYLFVCLAAACGGVLDSSFVERDRALTAATADSPGQAEIVCANKVVFFGRSGAPSGSAITAVTFDSRMVRRTCTATVAKNQTWSCTQTLADGGYTWTAQVA